VSGCPLELLNVARKETCWNLFETKEGGDSESDRKFAGELVACGLSYEPGKLELASSGFQLQAGSVRGLASVSSPTIQLHSISCRSFWIQLQDEQSFTLITERQIHAC